jgi:hypothetical protein
MLATTAIKAFPQIAASSDSMSIDMALNNA